MTEIVFEQTYYSQTTENDLKQDEMNIMCSVSQQ